MSAPIDLSNAPEPSAGGGGPLIPEGTLIGGQLKLQRTSDGKLVHTNPANGNQFMKAEVHVATAPYEGRIIYDVIGVKAGPKAAEGFMQLSDVKLRAIMETNGAGPKNPERYTINSRTDVNGLKVACRLMVDTSREKPRNKIGTYLSPLASTTADDFARLKAGDVHPKDAVREMVRDNPPAPPVTAPAPEVTPFDSQPPGWFDEAEGPHAT